MRDYYNKHGFEKFKKEYNIKDPIVTKDVIEEHFEKYYNYGKNRLDAFRTGLGLDQKFNTFSKNPDGTYKINDFTDLYDPFYFPNKLGTIDQYNTINLDGFFRPAGADDLTRINKLMDLYETNRKRLNQFVGPNYKPETVEERQSYSNNLRKFKPSVYNYNEASDIEGALYPNEFPFNKYSMYDIDQSGVMGGFRWDVKPWHGEFKPVQKNVEIGPLTTQSKKPINLHLNNSPNDNSSFNNYLFQYNDIWDLHPLQDSKSKFIPKFLKDTEFLRLMGGKPFHIKGNYIIDNKSGKILQSYKKGGQPPKASKGLPCPPFCPPKNLLISGSSTMLNALNNPSLKNISPHIINTSANLAGFLLPNTMKKLGVEAFRLSGGSPTFDFDKFRKEFGKTSKYDVTYDPEFLNTYNHYTGAGFENMYKLASNLKLSKKSRRSFTC